jgi:SAM-dependent methyltransferase
MTLSTAQQARLDIVDRLVKPTTFRTEATIQSDVRMLLLDTELGLADENLDVQLEAQVGNRRRIDIEVGCTVIEVKKSLASASVVDAAKEQLADYVLTRTAELGSRYVGVLTDGKTWIAFHEVDGALMEATRHAAITGPLGASALLSWLEGVLATKQGVRPTPIEIAERLGAESSSHALDYATLSALYADSKDLPTVQLKRELWADLLRSALGTQFTDDDALFLEHTLLVNSAEIIAHLVLGLDVKSMSPATLLSGDQFARAGLHGVVDRDFFDWILEVPGGEGFVSSLARRLARFDWSSVEHDVLKVLYESVIPSITRKALGEYYTPDWLAHEIVQQAVTDPLHQRVLDPSCGSGSFLFYAVRRYMAAADAAGLTLQESMHDVTSRVIGIDLHPVAVALARVTYLLALGRDRLNAQDRGELSVPVYLGDSLGWDQSEDLLSDGHLVIPTETGDQILSAELRFPDHLLDDAARFDDLVHALVSESGRAAGKQTNKLSEGTLRRLAVPEADVPLLNQNFVRLKQLHEADRDHIWSYYIRNVARPTWLAREENRVDVLVGNPPWLSYRHMSKGMQKTFKRMATSRGFWHNESTATHQDLAGLFIARAVERNLKSGGTFAFVVPNPVVDREYWEGFRTGRFHGANVAFSESWDLRRIRPHLFPRGAAVVFGRRGETAAKMPAAVEIWQGRAPEPHALAGADLETISRTQGTVAVSSADDERSAYASKFSNGANLFPRLLFRVEDDPSASLGVPGGRKAVRSQRTVSEKNPWKSLPAMTGAVESEFIWPTIMGEHVIPFGILDPCEFVLPMTRTGDLLSPTSSQIDRWPGLADWTRRADELWSNNQDGKFTLMQQINHMKKLTQQAPIPSRRVVYAASGMHISAAVLSDPRVIVEHGAYWASVGSPDEANYLVGILNTPSLTELARPFMSYGKDERHIDKNVWKLPIPTFDPDNQIHQQIVVLSEKLGLEAAEQVFATKNFVTIRKSLRRYISESEAGKELDALVDALLDTSVG